jgi:putative ABC transport system permease protein
MMDTRRSVNRSMFWRVIRRSLFANRGRLMVILLALGAGSAVTAALLNLQVDAKRRLTTEFRRFGANMIIAPREPSSSEPDSGSLSVEAVSKVVHDLGNRSTLEAPFLYFVANVERIRPIEVPGRTAGFPVVVAGTYLGTTLHSLVPGWESMHDEFLVYEDAARGRHFCIVGVKVAEQLQVQKGDFIRLFHSGREAKLEILQTMSAGDNVDNQIFVELETAQQLTSLNGRASLMKVSYAGTPTEIGQFRSALATSLPDLDVRPIRQFTEGEARLYNRISGILSATVAVVLILTVLCVMAAMTNVAMERKNDVGLMKAIGGSVRRVLRLFLAEAALLGLAGGLVGAAAGLLISIGLGKAVFGVAAQPRLIVYPISVALTVIVAILAAYPLRRLVQIRPASVFRGEE